jgi:predicted N-acetyltransferase YhbS
MITIRQERSADATAREALLDIAYGSARHDKPSARLRSACRPAAGLSLLAVENGRIIGSVRLWPVEAGRGRAALLLGPLAVHPDCRKRGIGAALMRAALAAAARRGHGAILLVGDAAYYGRFGFSAGMTGALWLSGADPARLLGLELTLGALAGARGRIASPQQAPALLGGLKPKLARRRARLVPRAA